MAKTKYTYESIKKYISEQGYLLLVSEHLYENVKTPLILKCPFGHTYTTSWTHFCKEGTRCKTCSRVGIDVVKNAFLKEGYVVLETEYKGSQLPISYICSRGHRNVSTWSMFRDGCRCPECVKKGYKEIVEEFAKEGYIIVSKEEEYTKAKFKFRFVCPNGHISSMNRYNFERGCRCGECAPNKKKSLLEILPSFEEKGYTLLSKEYIDEKRDLDFICPNGHIHKMTWSNFKKGQNCAKCSSVSSRCEREIAYFIKTSFPSLEVVQNDRNLINPYELDIFIPAKKIAIEYCGLYWHSEVSGGVERNYHRMKYNRCLEEGVRLITIFEDEYLEHKDIVLSRIQNALGFSKRIFARKLEVREVENKVASTFYDANHLQGRTGFIKSFGLYDGDTLLSCLSVGKLSRYHVSKGGTICELKRMSTVPYINIIGGFGKLFAAAKKYLAAETMFTSIKSYCDMRYANIFSVVYEKIGFILLTETQYSPHYIRDGRRLRNQSFAKKLQEKQNGQTEWQLRAGQGYDRIWDCGHRTYIYNF
jgi:hypothetical protein